MTTSKAIAGAIFATAAAGLFATAPITAQAAEAKIKCEGVNACKGQSACASARNACKGQNACKGLGFLDLTKKQCDEAKAKLRQHQG